MWNVSEHKKKEANRNENKGTRKDEESADKKYPYNEVRHKEKRIKGGSKEKTEQKENTKERRKYNS
jgi:hypothetical protein